MSSFSNPKKVMIPCRFSFLHCWEPDSVNGSEPKYSVSAIIPKSDTKTVNAIAYCCAQKNAVRKPNNNRRCFFQDRLKIVRCQNGNSEKDINQKVKSESYRDNFQYRCISIHEELCDLYRHPFAYSHKQRAHQDNRYKGILPYLLYSL